MQKTRILIYRKLAFVITGNNGLGDDQLNNSLFNPCRAVGVPPFHPVG